jgi:hypothetical protein
MVVNFNHRQRERCLYNHWPLKKLLPFYYCFTQWVETRITVKKSKIFWNVLNVLNVFYLVSSYFHFLDFFSLDSTHGPTVQQCENTSQLTFPISIYSVGRKEFHLGCSRPSRGASFGSKELLLTPPPPFSTQKLCAHTQ